MMRVERAAVLGAGTMGAQIAAHLANAGVPTLLLDILPRELTPELLDAACSGYFVHEHQPAVPAV